MVVQELAGARRAHEGVLTAPARGGFAPGGIRNKAQVCGMALDGRIFPPSATAATRESVVSTPVGTNVCVPLQVMPRDRVGRPG